MTIDISYLDEPKLQFGQFFEHQDTKTGLAEYGPFGKSVPGLHRSSISFGFVGTRATIAAAKEWIIECGSFIESENVKTIGTRSRKGTDSLLNDPANSDQLRTRLEKILNRDFVGFSRESPFESDFQLNDRWDRIIQPRELDVLLMHPDKATRILSLVDLFAGHIQSLATTSPTPDIIILALTPEIIRDAANVRVTGNFFLDFRRAIKARAMAWNIPIQLIQQRTLLGRAKTLQEKATRAWNFCTAQYYKAQGIPWRPTTLDADTCYIGINFYVAQAAPTDFTLRSSVAQAFDYLGQGLVLRGDPFEWKELQLGKSPHLTRIGASTLIQTTLKEYLTLRRIPPRRIVIHKTSEFWGPSHGEYNELDGLYEGIDAVFPHCETDFVALRQTGVHLFREGIYPPLRGTYFSLEGSQHFLYTMGFVPYLETYPGSYVPYPWQITDHHGGSAPKDLFREILALTKMNMNNCAFADGTPITIKFADEIGKVMKHISDDKVPQPSYRFYM